MLANAFNVFCHVAAIERIGRIGERTGLGDARGRPFLDLLPLDVEELRLVARIEEKRPFLAVDKRTRADVHHRLLVAVAGELKGDEFLAGILERSVEGVRPFVVVFAAAEEHSRRTLHRFRMSDPERPAGGIGEVRRVVAALGRAPVAEPVPVVVNDVVAVVAARRGALPELPVEPLRNGGRFAAADRGAVGHIPALRPLELSDDSRRTDIVDGFAVRKRSAALIAHLEDRARLIPGVDYDFALTRTEAAGLLHIDRLARAHREHRRIRVPVVGRYRNDAVDRLVFQNLAQILLLAGLDAGDFLDLGGGEIKRARIDIADIGDFHPGDFQCRTHDLSTPPLGVAADHRQPHAVRGRIRAERLTGRRDEKSSGTGLDEISPVHCLLLVLMSDGFELKSCAA